MKQLELDFSGRKEVAKIINKICKEIKKEVLFSLITDKLIYKIMKKLRKMLEKNSFYDIEIVDYKSIGEPEYDLCKSILCYVKYNKEEFGFSIFLG